MMVHGVQHVLQGKNWAVHICSVPINTALRLVVSKDLPRSDGITSFLFSPSHILATITTNDNPLEECKQFHTGAQSSGPKNCFCVQPGVSFSLQRAELLIEMISVS